MKVLLLEDSPLDAEIIERMVKKQFPNCEWQTSVNRSDFLTALDTYLPDIILSDNSLPQFNATEALKLVRERYPYMPFVLVTGTVSEEFAASIIKQGADDYLLKDRMTRLPVAMEAAIRYRSTEKQKETAARELLQSEEKYRKTMERVSDAFVAIDANWNYSYVNKRAGEIMRKDPRYLQGKNIWTEFPEGVGQPFHTAYYRAMADQTYIHLEEYYEPFDVWLENHIYPSADGLSIFFQDITERKKTENAINQSRENLKAIFDNSSEGFILIDKTGNIKIFNERAATSIFTLSIHNLQIGRSIFETIEQGRLAFFKNIFSSALQGNTIQYDRSYTSEDGSITWINFSLNPVRKEGQVDGVCITGRDITERKLAEQQREFDHNNLGALINNTRDLIWSVDRQFKLITFNQAFEEMVSKMSGAIVKKGHNVLSTTFNAELQQRYRDYYERAFTGESFTETEYYDNPVEFWSDTSFYPIFEKGRVVGTACYSRDITSRKQAEAELEKLRQKQLESKIEEQKRIARAMLSAQEKERNAIGCELHDNVNQILVGTILMLSIVKSNPEKHKAFIDSCSQQLQDAVQENRKIAHLLVAPDLHSEDMLSQLKHLSDNMLRTAGIRVNYSAGGYEEKLLDSERKLNIYRIAQEQCTNIVKYANASIVDFMLHTTNDAFEMTIADNGVGMNTKKKPTGVGMRNIKNRLAIFNGSMVVETEAGQGFQLTIIIPLENSVIGS